MLFVSCKSENSNTEQNDLNSNEPVEVLKNKIDIESIKEKLCSDFPKELILKYNPDAKSLEIESIDNGSGGILHCNLKLFYGNKEHEFWKGQVSANINQMEDPFWQYNPNRNPSLYHLIDGLGQKAVYISNIKQLQILKDGVLYSITPPNSGNITSSGKEMKEIALEIAKHYSL
jgi:hypothetical protein